MRSIFKKYPWLVLCWLAVMWSLFSFLIGSGPLRTCFSFGYAESWCNSPFISFLQYSLNLPFLAGFTLALFSPFGVTSFIIGSLAASLLIIFIIRIILKIAMGKPTEIFQNLKKIRGDKSVILSLQEKRLFLFIIFSTVVMIVGSFSWSIFKDYSTSKKSKQVNAQRTEERKRNIEELRSEGVLYPTYFPPSLNINPTPGYELPSTSGTTIGYYSSSYKEGSVLKLQYSKIAQWGRPLSALIKEFPRAETVILADGSEAILTENSNSFELYLDRNDWRINVALYKGSKTDLIKIAESLR